MPINAYNCCVRPAGQLTHEVPKKNISAKEIMILRFVHGNDAVIKIERIGEFKDYDERRDLEYMAAQYGPAAVQRVFNVFIDPLAGMDVDMKEYITNFSVIEQEAKLTDMQSVLREAGGNPNANRLPEKPLAVGDAESRAAVDYVHGEGEAAAQLE